MSVITGYMRNRGKERKSVMSQEDCLVGDKLRMSCRQQAGGVNATVSALGEDFSRVHFSTVYRNRKKSR